MPDIKVVPLLAASLVVPSCCEKHLWMNAEHALFHLVNCCHAPLRPPDDG